MSGRHSTRPGRPGRRNLTAVAAATVATALIGAGCYAFAGSFGCAARGTVDLHVAVAPEIEPAIRPAADRLTGERHVAGGKCVRAVVTTAEPAAVAAMLSGTGGSQVLERKPDVWIPDSSLWSAAAPGGEARMPQPGFSIAQSPIVAGVPVSAKGRPTAGSPPKWLELLAGKYPKARVTDPGRSAAGMGLLMIVRTLLAEDPAATEKFTGIVRGAREGVVQDTRTLFSGPRGRLVIASEQAVRSHNRDRPAEPLEVVWPADGTLALDYPYTVVADAEDRTEAARLLEREIRTERTRAALRSLGFRTGRPDTEGIRLLPDPEPSEVRATLQAWAKLSLTSRMLSVLDVSGSMAARVPGSGGKTRMQVLAQAAQLGLSYQPDDTELGQWVFSTRMDGRRDWRQTVELGPLGERTGSVTRRQRILSSLSSLRPKPDGDTGLYDSVIAAVEYMRETYKPDMVNTVLLMTDGRNDDADGPTLEQTLRRLREGADPARPVQVVIIGFGDEVDRNELNRIARATGGSVHIAHTAKDMERIFLAGTSRRICSPRC
ncbi:substrate-binding and VWA domain-containing protein [Thermomonospora amylolytica]|uniref:substrate-binding and VWA domain-containing protein n=1 Tax=Thermomonospora amylolytica TaxID=1411117 RepID=UPI000E6B938C|nr:substrate-binding and VWA domain-containing protein [Thermomonospora amylolytica]